MAWFSEYNTLVVRHWPAVATYVATYAYIAGLNCCYDST